MKNIDLDNLKIDNKNLSDLFNQNQNYDLIFNEEENNKLFFFKDKNIFYGKVDTNNNFVILKNESKASLPGPSNPIVCDIVAKAFVDLLNYYKKARSFIQKNSFYYNIEAKYGMESVNEQYVKYLSNYYSSLIEYLLLKKTKIKNHLDFFDFFIEASGFFAKKQNLPLTRTGFIGSIYCKTSATGLVIDLSGNTDNDQKKYSDYLSDPNFLFFLDAARKFNFLVDKDKPWRLVFNIFDLENLLRKDVIRDCETILPNGDVKYPEDAEILRPMGYFAMHDISSIQDFFEKKYHKSMIGNIYDETTEIETLKKVFIQTYNTYVIPNENIIYGKDLGNVVKLISKKREPLYSNDLEKSISNKTWLKLLMYLRALESRQQWNQTDFNDAVNKTLIIYNNYGLRAACNHINNLTKNILDLDRISTRVVDREYVINRINSENEGFIFR